jgi:hypothetical protein
MQALGLPGARLARDGDCDFDVGPPHREALLTDAAWWENQEGAVRGAARNAHRRYDPLSQTVGLAKRSCFMAQAHSFVRGVEAHTGDDSARMGFDRSSTGVAGRKALDGLAKRRVDQKLRE